ncbi:hypothetical protein OF83DRAFT_1258250 [Amylostereum chailletii]|nr:hypothetical protein OF83DRAFT_1258250 [Amylostereum chailletii]
MSAKPRHSASASTPQNPSKLPKFLQSKQTRDRSRSVIDPTMGSSSTSTSPSAYSDSQIASSSTSTPSPRRSLMRKGSKLFAKDKDKDVRPSSPAPSPAAADADISDDFIIADESIDEAPVIIEPLSRPLSPPLSPRQRTRSERPLSTTSDSHPSLSYYQTSHSSSRLSDLPTRLSGWFSHTFNSSNNDLTLPALLSNASHIPNVSSPKGKANALLTAAKHGKGHLDKAMRYLLDSDATPDRCADPIWLMGVQHPGYEPPPPEPVTPPRRGSIESSRRSPSLRSSTSSTVVSGEHLSLSQSQPASSKHPSASWPPDFYSDFTSRVWLTYRSQFQPIRDSTLSALEAEQHVVPTAGPTSPQPKRWNWPGTGERGWTSDAGWGCMLRTGQSLLATALFHLHLGRDWRRPPQPVFTADYALYVQMLTWFFDSPSPLCPFSVHRMALAGKDLGKDVGQWFGPSTAAGALKTLTHAFPDAGLGVSVAVDGQIFQTDVYAASHPPQHPLKRKYTSWGGRAVLVLIGVRLGLDGVNPIYYDTIKALYTFPQSIGIAGGRPSSSYYFVGSQADNLFYLDPHHTRPAVPLRPPPSAERDRSERQTTPERPTAHHRSPTSPASSRTASSTFSYHAPTSPSPLAHQLSTSSSSSGAHVRWRSTSPRSPGSDFSSDVRIETDLDPLQEHFVTAYSPMELRTFHCNRVRKLPLSGLDPSMLIAFLCKDENDWKDLRRRIAELSRNHKTIFSILDEPPSWPSDSDDNMGLESMSEPDIDMPEDDEDGDFFDASEGRPRSPSTSPDVDGSSSSGRGEAKSVPSEVDTEEDPIGPLTPGPASRSTFESDRSALVGQDKARDVPVRESSMDADDEDWVDPSVPTPRETSAPPMAKSASNQSSASEDGGKKKRKKREKSAKEAGGVPVVKAPSPPPPQQQQQQQHFPFPTSTADGAGPEDKRRVPQMSNTRARDGGRTQSGGVKGILTNEDGDDF